VAQLQRDESFVKQILDDVSTLKNHLAEIRDYAYSNPNTRVATDALLQNVLAKLDALGNCLELGPGSVLDAVKRNLTAIYETNHTQLTTTETEASGQMFITYINRKLAVAPGSGAHDNNLYLPLLPDPFTELYTGATNGSFWSNPQPPLYFAETRQNLDTRISIANTELHTQQGENNNLFNSQRRNVEDQLLEICYPKTAAIRREQQAAARPGFMERAKNTLVNAASRFSNMLRLPLRSN